MDNRVTIYSSAALAEAASFAGQDLPRVIWVQQLTPENGGGWVVFGKSGDTGFALCRDGHFRPIHADTR